MAAHTDADWEQRRSRLRGSTQQLLRERQLSMGGFLLTLELHAQQSLEARAQCDDLTTWLAAHVPGFSYWAARPRRISLPNLHSFQPVCRVYMRVLCAGQHYPTLEFAHKLQAVPYYSVLAPNTLQWVETARGCRSGPKPGPRVPRARPSRHW